MRSVLLYGAINILFSCTPHLLTSDTMVHHDERGDTTRPAVVPSDPSEETMRTKCSL